MARGIPVLAGGDDLRRQCRDPAEHHRPPTARPGARALIDRGELELFARSLRRAVESHSGAALDAALEEVGWRDALGVDPHAAVGTLFELQGEVNAASSALEHVLVDALGIDTVPTAGLVLPALGRWHPPAEIDGDRIVVRGLGTAALADRGSAVVVAANGGETVGVVVQVADLTLRVVRGLDPSLGLVEVTGETPRRDQRLSPVRWTAALARGQIALGHELVGASRRMLALAREHALQRVQFGRPIAAFQAIRHRLADALVAIETADAALAAAWQDESPETAAMAKALAGRGARTVARHCQQVLAGIGFTSEHPLHRYVRRVLVIDQLLGSARALTRELGTELARRKKLPPPLPL